MILQAILAYVLVSIIIQAPVLWIARRMIVGAERAKFMDAVTITIIAAIVNAISGALLGKNLAGFVQLVAYLFLIVKYYDTDDKIRYNINNKHISRLDNILDINHLYRNRSNILEP